MKNKTSNVTVALIVFTLFLQQNALGEPNNLGSTLDQTPRNDQETQTTVKINFGGWKVRVYTK